MRRTFKPVRDLPAHSEGTLEGCWCNPWTLQRLDDEGQVHYKTFHNDDMGFAFGLFPMPYFAIATNPFSDDYAVEPPTMYPRRPDRR